MTPESCRNGTERCAAAPVRLGGGYDIVVNLQGDAPLTPPWFVSALVEAMQADPERQVATPVLRCDADALAGFLDDRRARAGRRHHRRVRPRRAARSTFPRR